MNRLPALIGLLLAVASPAAAAGQRPNFLVVLTDDVGWGDFACYNPGSKLATPSVDRLAREGMLFTHAHAPASLCAPTRYSMVTGNYPWRGRIPGGTWAFNVPSQLQPGQKTAANLLKEAGYHTAMFGKQGFGGQHAKRPDGSPDFTRPMIEGPKAWGFDYAALIPKGHQNPPLLFLVNELPECGADKVQRGADKRQPDGANFTEPDWDPAAVGRRLLGHAEKFLEWHLAQNKAAASDAPFYMHFCTDGAHSPYVPAETLAGRPLKGQTKMTAHTDMVLETDILLGALMEMLEKRGLLDNTLICFTSDNGGLPYERNFGHDAVGGLRGKKSFIFEGGHRVPFLIRWPGRIAPGSVRHQFVGAHDIVATMLDLAGAPVPEDQCLDSVSLAPVLLGERDDRSPVRRHLLVDSSVGRDAFDDGGVTDASVVISDAEARAAAAKERAASRKPGAARITRLPSGGIARALYEENFKLVFDIQDRPAALYDLRADPGEQKNMLDDAALAERLKAMTQVCREIRASKRSTPAAPSSRPLSRFSSGPAVPH